jgi:hypothetical protein
MMSVHEVLTDSKGDLRNDCVPASKALLLHRHSYYFTDILTTSQTFLLLYTSTDSKGVLLKDERKRACFK